MSTLATFLLNKLPRANFPEKTVNSCLPKLKFPQNPWVMNCKRIRSTPILFSPEATFKIFINFDMFLKPSAD